MQIELRRCLGLESKFDVLLETFFETNQTEIISRSNFIVFFSIVKRRSILLMLKVLTKF